MALGGCGATSSAERPTILRKSSGSVAPSVPNTRTVLSERRSRRLAGVRIARREQQADEAGDRGFPGAHRAVPEAVESEEAHAFGGRLVPDGHESVGADVQNRPGEGRDFAAGEAGHHGVERAFRRRRPAALGTAIEAVGFIRLDDNDTRPIGAEALPQVGAHGSRQSADPGLHEHMGGRHGRRLRQRLLDHQRVTLHHVARDIGEPLVRRIGNDVPVLRRGIGGRAPHRIVVSPRHAPDLRAVGGDRATASFAGAFRQVDDAPATEIARTPRDGAAMIAVGGGGHGDVRGHVGIAAGQAGRGMSLPYRPLACGSPPGERGKPHRHRRAP